MAITCSPNEGQLMTLLGCSQAEAAALIAEYPEMHVVGEALVASEWYKAHSRKLTLVSLRNWLHHTKVMQKREAAETKQKAEPKKTSQPESPFKARCAASTNQGP